MAEPVILIINEPPYGNEKAWNALRLAKALAAAKQTVWVFLLGDGVGVAKKGQKPPSGFYNLGAMLRELAAAGAHVSLCGTCVESRGIKAEELVEGVEVGKMLDLARWVGSGSKILVF
jgi:uncharacterized protein involved in oxidation of intracellular sulfur